MGPPAGPVQTYEAAMAAASVGTDPIRWTESSAFRNRNYRLLHHQRGLCGLVAIRLLEGAGLERSHWTPLALGPVRHLGLSRAHGAVSAFCTLTLHCADHHHHQQQQDGDNGSSSSTSTQHQDINSSTGKSKSANSGKTANIPQQQTKKKCPSVVSPVVPNDSNPVWDNCHYEFPLAKGACGDGQRVCLQVAVEEDGTAIERFLPTGGGGGGGGTDRLLGVGTLDLTELCLGETASGQTLPGIQDAWIDIVLHEHEPIQQHCGSKGKDLSTSSSSPYCTNDPLAPPPSAKEEEPSTRTVARVKGRVRVLVSYAPCGLEPQPRDVVAFESFARRRHPRASTCRPVLDPFLPLTVLDRRGSYLLCEYALLSSRGGNSTAKACVRLHRNAVFVIERQNWVDAAHNLALLPVDVALSTPVGRATQHALAPVAHAVSELVMPAALSLKLVWVATRTTGLGVLSGVGALASTVWHEGSHSLTGGGSHSGGGGLSASHHLRHRGGGMHGSSNANAKFVQL
jgi:hypothetical protein